MLLSREFGTPVSSQSDAVGWFATGGCLDGAKPQEASGSSVIEIRAATRSGEPVYFQELFIPQNARRLYIDDSLRR